MRQKKINYSKIQKTSFIKIKFNNDNKSHRKFILIIYSSYMNNIITKFISFLQK